MQIKSSNNRSFIKYIKTMENFNHQNSSLSKERVSQNIQTQKKNLYDKYINYIDSSKCTVQHYQQKSFLPGQEKYIQKISTFIQEDNNPNKPLVFETEPGCGIKTILVNWQKNQSLNRQKKNKNLSILHFASNGSNNRNYFYSLYRIIIKLREAFKLKQNVDLLEQNIRKFFTYWLDICSQQVQKQLVIYCAQNIYNKIVIVIEGVNQFIDAQTGKQANIAFWLPEIFPKNVKVILTASKGSQSLQYLKKIKCKIVEVKFNSEISLCLLTKCIKQKTILNQKIEAVLKETLKKIVNRIGLNNNIYNFIDCFKGNLLIKQSLYDENETICLIRQALNQKISIQRVQKIENISELYNFVIDFWIQNSPLKDKLQNILIYLCLTQKGLTPDEILKISRINQNEWVFFLVIFDFLIVKYEGTYSIKSSSFTQTLFQRIKKNQNLVQSSINFLTPYHESLALILQSSQNSLRKIQELTYHLFTAKSYFKLKQTISNIQNFLLMFNYNNNYELNKYWQKLQEKGFDPVIQYNKAVEGFSMHYHPSDQNIFRILVQISKFLKEFCDFQSYETPNFRHPYIQGNALQLHKIGLLKQLSDLDIFFDNSFNNKEYFDLGQEYIVQEEIKETKAKYFPKECVASEKTQGIKNLSTERMNEMNIINQMISNMQEISKTKIKKKNNQSIKILSDIQQLNVDVPMNREKFRNHYLKLLQQSIEKDKGYGPVLSKQKIKQNSYLDESEMLQSVSEEQVPIRYSLQKIRDNYRLQSLKPSLYYYKRWIWIQFPWVCISLNNNYSKTPQLCQKIQNDQSQIFQVESKYKNQALLVAIEAREKKKLMFTKKDDYLDSRGFSKTKTNIFNISKSNTPRGQTAPSNTRLAANKLIDIPDLNLSTLTKELQLRKKIFKNSHQQLEDQCQFFLSQINQNCIEDMKFIALRKPFNPPTIKSISSNEILPKLKWVIKQHTNYELSYIKCNIEEKKKKLNKIIYENKKLSQIYQELKIKEINLKKNTSNQYQSQKQIKKNKILEDLIKKKEEVINEFCKSILQKQRLKIILKLCFQNKTKNQQYVASLNYFLQNLKKMIHFQKDNMKSISEELNEIKIFKEKQNILQNQKQKNQRIVAKQAENYLQEKLKLENQISNITSFITQEIKDQKDKLQSSLSGLMINKEEKTLQIIHEKKAKLHQEKLSKLQNQYLSLKNIFDFQGFQFQKSQKFQKLMDLNQRNKQLRIANQETKNKLEQLQTLYQKVKGQNLKNLQSESEMKFKSSTPNSQRQNSGNQKNIKKHNQNKFAIILDNIGVRVGARDKGQIVSVLKKKIQSLKYQNVSKYSKLFNNDKVIIATNEFCAK